MKPVPVPTVDQIRLGGHSEWADGKHCLIGERNAIIDMAAESQTEIEEMCRVFHTIYVRDSTARRLTFADCPNTLANRRAAVRILKRWLKRCGFRETKCPEPPRE